MIAQPPAAIRKTRLAAARAPHVVPVLIADAGEQASWRYVEFFSANIRNANTRRAYARACSAFLAWCEARGLTLTQIRPHDVGAYIEALQGTAAAPSVKQSLAAIRMLFDWLVIGRVMPSNPAASVRGPRHVVKTGKTPVLEGDEWRKLIDSIPTKTVRDLRDRAPLDPGPLQVAGLDCAGGLGKDRDREIAGEGAADAVGLPDRRSQGAGPAKVGAAPRHMIVRREPHGERAPGEADIRHVVFAVEDAVDAPGRLPAPVRLAAPAAGRQAGGQGGSPSANGSSGCGSGCRVGAIRDRPSGGFARFAGDFGCHGRCLRSKRLRERGRSDSDPTLPE
jgi:hypothetical protein